MHSPPKPVRDIFGSHAAQSERLPRNVPGTIDRIAKEDIKEAEHRDAVLQIKARMKELRAFIELNPGMTKTEIFKNARFSADYAKAFSLLMAQNAIQRIGLKYFSSNAQQTLDRSQDKNQTS